MDRINLASQDGWTVHPRPLTVWKVGVEYIVYTLTRDDAQTAPQPRQ